MKTCEACGLPAPTTTEACALCAAPFPSPGPSSFRLARQGADYRWSVDGEVVATASLDDGRWEVVDAHTGTPAMTLIPVLTPTGVKAFTTATDQQVGDETKLIAHFLARYPQFELERSSLSEASFCQHYREAIYHMDEPFARQSAYVRWEIANLTKQHRRKVLLNGEGADEVLGGYVSFAPRFLVDLLKKRHPIRLARELYATLLHPERRRIVRELGGVVSRPTSRMREARAKASELQRKFGIRMERVEDASPRYGDIKDFLDAQVRGYSLPRLLTCNDTFVVAMSMANSVEGRAPFLDHEFVDLVFSMETTDLMVKGWRKFPLREAMNGLIPDDILFRKSKDTFNAPIFDYLRSESIRQRVGEIFQEPRTAAIFNPRAYVSEYERFLERRGADRPFLLHGLFLEEWARMFEVEFA